MSALIRNALSGLRISTHRNSSLLGTGRIVLTKTMSTDAPVEYNFETLNVTRPREYVVQVELNRPKKLNAMNMAFWGEMRDCFRQLSEDKDCRAVVISGAGRIFTAGLDLIDAGSILKPTDGDVGRQGIEVRKTVFELQESFNVIEKCPKPVIAAVHNGCVGGGVDMITACDIRYCTEDAWFQVKEIDIGIVADLGTLQRLPKVLGNDSLARELAYTSRKLPSEEAKQSGLVSKVFADRDAVINGALDTAALIASKSPIAIQGIKVNMIYSRDHSVKDGLDFVAAWNQGMIQSEDVMKAAVAGMQKETPTFSKL